jgi:transposase-like protein
MSKLKKITREYGSEDKLRQELIEMLNEYGVKETARRLGVTRHTLYDWALRLGLDRKWAPKGEG